MTSPAAQVFADPVAQEAFERDGFVVVDALSAEQVSRFRAHFARIRPPAIEGMYSNVHDLTLDQNREVGRAIADNLAALADRLCPGYRLQGGTFLVKGTGAGSVCELHQDWNTVDERAHLGLTIWVALEDVSPENGCLAVIPGSHRLDLRITLRGANLGDAHLPFDDELGPHVVDLPLRAGQACVFAQNLFHGSRPNLSGTDRVALYAGLIPHSAEMIHLADLGDGTCGVLRIDEGFYYSGEAAALAAGGATERGVIERLTFDLSPVSRSELLDALAKQRVAQGGRRGGRLRRLMDRRRRVVS